MGALSLSILDLLQKQYKLETANSLQYVARASWCRFRGFESTADFFDDEAKGESKHAKIVKNYIEDRSQAVNPAGFNLNGSFDFGFYDDLFTSALEIEYLTTDALSEIYEESQNCGDYRTAVWVQSLLVNQIDEEKQYQTIIDRIVQRGGGGQDYGFAFAKFRLDPSAAHDIDVWIGGLK